MAGEQDEYEDFSKLPSSRLGTKQHWDDTYKRELSNFKEHGDVGEIWFGESCMNRMIMWIKKSPKVTKTSSILDIGCGNGILAISLARDGYTDLLGIDYSAAAVQLAVSVAEQEHVHIKFMEYDVLNPSISPLTVKTFDVCLDKGTYDAVSLNPEDSSGCRTKYIRCVAGLLRESGLLVITSCNWTKAELIEQFSEEFQFLEDIPAPSFTFGGKTGRTVTSVIFGKKTKRT